MLNPQSRPNNIREYVIGNVVTELRKDERFINELHRRISNLEMDKMCLENKIKLREMFPFKDERKLQPSLLETICLVSFFLVGTALVGKEIRNTCERLEANESIVLAMGCLAGIPIVYVGSAIGKFISYD